MPLSDHVHPPATASAAATLSASTATGDTRTVAVDPETHPAIVVVGSANMDLVVRAPRLPSRGETLRGSHFETIPGGKGANQAVAAARLGAAVTMVACIGDDAFGQTLRTGLEADGIDTRHVARIDGVSSGIAAISVADDGANTIVIVGGANDHLDNAAVDAAAASIAAAKMLICQLETPLAVVEHAIDVAVREKTPVLLNPAPAQPLAAALLAKIDYLIVNETEAHMLSGVAVETVDDAREAARALRAQGARCVIVTLGAQGVMWQSADEDAFMPAQRVKAVDTTAAGDTFAGGFAAARAAGASLRDAMTFGQRAAAICVTRHGAQTSIPCRDELLRPDDRVAT